MTTKTQITWLSAFAALTLLMVGCGSDGSETGQPTPAEAVAAPSTPNATSGEEAVPTDATVDSSDASQPVLGNVESPVGGTVKQVTVPGPEISVLVNCDQAGFVPFFFTDQGDWVGCQIVAGTDAGPQSALTEPVMNEVTSAVGGTVMQVTIPGPETSVLVVCGEAGFVPFFFTDQGDWIGCQTNP